MGKLGDNYTPPASVSVQTMPPVCKWILSVLNKAVVKTVSAMESYKFSDATSAVYFWWLSQLCDVFIEAIKPYFFNDSKEFESQRAASRDALWICLDAGLRLLHPFMPYVTEELWQRLPQAEGSCRKESIMISDYPSVVEVCGYRIEKSFFLACANPLLCYKNIALVVNSSFFPIYFPIHWLRGIKGGGLFSSRFLETNATKSGCLFQFFLYEISCSEMSIFLVLIFFSSLFIGVDK
jgi:Anticodon-binding domain of tRNA ligase